MQEVEMIHHQTCCLCEANCGLLIEHDGEKVLSIRGNPEDVLSQGYLCPKATALRDLHEDPDRLRQPMRRVGEQWIPVSWEEAIEEITTRFHDIQQKHGKNAIAYYVGNPNVHSYGNLLAILFVGRLLRTRSRFSASSADQLPHMLASLLMFGHQLMVPIPDVDRTDLMIIVGGNPVVSNGSLMTAPNMRDRLKAIRQRGGRVIVIDPRRTETAKLAEEHHFIRPGTDALLFCAMLQTMAEEQLFAPGAWRSYTHGFEQLAALVAPFTPERVAATVGIQAPVIRELARIFASTPKAALYGRMGVCTQRHGGLSAWLIHVLNLVTGHLDIPGGVMFPQPAVDLLALSARLGQRGSFGRWRSRVRQCPEFGGELPVSVLREEMETPGDGQIKALLTIAGNPVLSTPNGASLAQALSQLEFMVSLDPYITATSRYAHLILPPPSPLQRDHFALVFDGLSVRDTVKYNGPLFSPDKDAHHDWETLLAIGEKLSQKRGGWRNRWAAIKLRGLRFLGMRRILQGMFWASPEGPIRGFFGKRLSLSKLERSATGVDLGPLRPCLPQRLFTPDRQIQLVPPLFLEGMQRLQREWEEQPADTNGSLLLIGRRHLHSNNSWLHNIPHMVRGNPRCTLLMNPRDAEEREMVDGQRVVVTSRVGQVQVTLAVTDDMMSGVVSLPHGWGHREKGSQMQVANATEGVSANDLTDDLFFDELTGNAGLNGVPVQVHAVS